MPTPKLVAHRGYMLRYPENTRLGLWAALEAGAGYIEFDLQMNADQEFIVIHDDNFRRTAGVQQSVFTASTRKCRSISVHQPELFKDEFNPTFVSTLTEILELNARYPASTALVEIKNQSIEFWSLERTMDRLIRELEPYREQCVLISFSDVAINHVQQHSHLKTGWLLERYDETHREKAAQLQADFLMCNYQFIPEGEAPWPEFARWMLFDIADPQLALAYSKMGVELIETADIEGLKMFFTERNEGQV